MKRVLLAISAFLYTLSGSAQQEAQFSQNMFLNNVFNPGASGIKGMHCLSLVGRDQWTGFEGNPFTGLLSYSGVIPGVDNFGIGAVMVYDKIGFEQNLNFKVSGSYHLPIGKNGGKLGLGIDLGFIQKGISGNIVAENQTDPVVAGLMNGANAMNMDVGFGAFYFVPKKLYFGISGQKLVPQKIDLGSAQPTLRQHGYVTAGYYHPINANFTLKPNMLVKTDLSSTQLDANLTVEYKETFWLGASYRVQDAIVANFGFNIYSKDAQGKIQNHNNPWKVGFAYDFTTQGLREGGVFTFWDGNQNITDTRDDNRSFGAVEVYISKCFLQPAPPPFDTYVDPLFL